MSQRFGTHMLRNLMLRAPLAFLLAPFVFVSVGFVSVGAAGAEETAIDPEHARFFESKIRPLLAEHCWKCHDGDKQKGGVRLDSLAAMLRGGDSGAAVVPGKPDESVLIEAVRYEGYEMPPSGPLSDNEVEALETWVRLGAPWPGARAEDMRADRTDPSAGFTQNELNWWAIQPVQSPQIPVDIGQEWAINPIDHFVARSLQANGLSPAPQADKETLIRRLCFDLTGLPPTQEQLDAFLSDDSPDAYEALVDRLLESAAYGERFARHWLDLVRYADSDGYRADFTRPHAWRYRDYVIDAFNSDMPYDQFVKEQLAGDELYPDNPAARIATGFFTHGIYEYNNRDAVGQWDIMLNEITDTIGDVFLGVGMQCSRCHDHKFDPILQRDYFALRAFVEPLLLNDAAVCASEQQRQDFNAAEKVWLEKTQSIRDQLTELEKTYREKAKRIAVIKFPESTQAMMHKAPEERTPREQQIAALAYRQVDFEYDRMDKLFSKEDKEKILALRRELQAFDSIKPDPLPLAQTVQNTRGVPETRIPKKRISMQPDFLSILKEVSPDQATTLVSTTSSESAATPDKWKAEAEGRRSMLAHWIADSRNPLTTRVIVNRVWQTHFGKGLAPNASDFGFLGGQPSHPELLDWLTLEFLRGGWHFKPLHRLIVTSATYRQSSIHPESDSLMQIDPRNTWYWRSNIQRLDAEQIRDAILAVSGRLDSATGGPASTDDKHRRSIYTIVLRNSRNPLLDAFDLPLFFTSTASRDTTTNPLQSLLLINSQAMLDHAKQLAGRLKGQPDQDAVNDLWRLTYGRAPSSREQSQALEFLKQQAARYQPQDPATKHSLQTSTLAYRDSPAVVLKPDSKIRLRSAQDESLKLDAFTIETTFQLNSIYESGSVRSMVSTWNGKSNTSGWTFGVTGKGSRRKPQTLVLHAFGSNGIKPVVEDAVFSDQHVAIGKPYYAAAVVKPATKDHAGSVTFYLKDLSDDEQPMSIVEKELQLIDGLSGPGQLAIGGRVSGTGSDFDGLISDVRLSKGHLEATGLLVNDDEPAEATVCYWRFIPSAGLEKDSSGHQLDLRISQPETRSESPSERSMIDLCHVLLNSSEFLYVR